MLPLKRHLLLLVLGALVPMLILAVALTLLMVRNDRERSEHALYEQARLLSRALDAELRLSIAALHSLASSNALHRGNLDAFYAEAKEAREGLRIWDNVVLVSPSGAHLLNLLRPLGAPLPALEQPKEAIAAARERRPYISNVVQGTVRKRWITYISIPVLYEDKMQYVLAATLSPDYWSAWLAEQAPQDYIASIIDRNHNILARSRDAERLVGQPVQPWFRDLLARENAGTVRGEGVVDPDVVVAFYRSEVAGWHINLLTSGSVLDMPARRSALLLAVGVALALVIAVALALVRSRVLTRDIDRVVSFLQGGLRAKNEELSQADRRKDEFLATLAHELRNPLAPIRTAAEILRHENLSAETRQTARAMIARQAQHMTRMVDDLLEVGRITHGELQLRKEPVELAAAVRWAVEATQAAFDSAGVRLSVSLPAEPVWLDADPTRLTQILANLLGNAAKFTHRGGNAWLSAHKDGATVEIRVRDDGAGIEEKQLPRLFEMFSQATPALERTQGGLGIGLALVRGLVERHGGTVEAKSEGPGRGAEFIVRLPAAEAPAASAPGATRSMEQTNRRVLVVDDNRDAADSLAALLRTLGHEVRVAYDGEHALGEGERFRPDALILDIGMPRVNGYDVAARARQSDWGRGTKLIALTGWGQERDKATAAEAGFDHHLTKPVDLPAIEALLA